MIGLSLALVAVSLIIYAFLKWRDQKYAYFTKRNVKFQKLDMIKGVLDLVLRRVTFPDLIQKLYTEFPDEAYVLQIFYIIYDVEQIEKVVDTLINNLFYFTE